MKLAYLYIGGGRKKTSVQRKVVSQIEAMRKNGIDATGYFFSEEESEGFIGDFIKIIPFKRTQITNKWFRSYHEADALIKQVAAFVEQNLGDYEILYLRHYRSTFNYVKMLRKYADKLVLYIPSHVIKENFRERQVPENTGLVSVIIKWWEYFRYIYLYEKYVWKFILKKLKAVVVFTEEFAEILRSQAFGSPRIIYNRDGVNCAEVALRELEKTEDPVVKLLFMKGSSLKQSWSGLQRLISSVEGDNKKRFEIYITGSAGNDPEYKKDFVKCVGHLSPEELQLLVNKVDLGISNLANYMIAFNTTSNLKSREYYARGLPFIQANEMPDIDGYEAADCYLQLPNNHLPIDMNLVYDYAMKMRNNPLHAGKMRQFAEEHLDWKVTVAELSEQLKSLT